VVEEVPELGMERGVVGQLARAKSLLVDARLLNEREVVGSR
jgi:hypothetical protein